MIVKYGSPCRGGAMEARWSSKPEVAGSIPARDVPFFAQVGNTSYEDRTETAGRLISFNTSTVPITPTSNADFGLFFLCSFLFLPQTLDDI